MERNKILNLNILLALFKGRIRKKYVDFISAMAKDTGDIITRYDLKENIRTLSKYVEKYDPNLEYLSQHYIDLFEYSSYVWATENSAGIEIETKTIDTNSLPILFSEKWQLIYRIKGQSLLVYPGKIKFKKYDIEYFDDAMRQKFNEILHKTNPNIDISLVALQYKQKINTNWVVLSEKDNIIQIESNVDLTDHKREKDCQEISAILYNEEDKDIVSNIISPKASLYNKERIGRLVELIQQSNKYKNVSILSYGGSYDILNTEIVDTRAKAITPTKLASLAEDLLEHYQEKNSINDYDYNIIEQLSETIRLNDDNKNSFKRKGQYVFFVYNNYTNQVEYLMYEYDFINNKIKLSNVRSKYVKQELFERLFA